jgi:anion-transporting  ArsA/GET3 family ATPase
VTTVPPPAPFGPSLGELLRTQRVLITVGAGGVGKTTTAAALGVAAARAGRHVLTLTIDPARRLAESLGFREMTGDAALVDPARFASIGIPVTGSLTCMMLDTKRTFDELVRKHSSTPEKAEKLLANPLYQNVSASLAGTQEYMAMEKLVAVKADTRYDLIILDTPPTANALDFLDAPERLVSALDSATMKFFVEAFQSSGRFSLNLLAKGASAILKGIGKITGAGFLEAMSEFIAELNDLFGGFKERAAVVESALRAADTSFVLVTSPSPPSIREVLYFAERLHEANMARGAFVVNRLRVGPRFASTPLSESDTAAASALAPDVEFACVLRAREEASRLASLDARHLTALTGAPSVRGVPVVRVAELPTDVHDLKLLSQLGEILVA